MRARILDVVSHATRSWPGEHPARRALERGADCLTDAELVALASSPRLAVDAVSEARVLLQTCGGLRELLDAAAANLGVLPGASPARLARLSACRELARRYLAAPLRRGDVLQHAGDTRRFVLAQLGGRRQEIFAALFLDARNRLLHYEEMFRGTIDGASVHPREVVRTALEVNAAALIVAHNHPSGEPEPSAADRAITERLRLAVDLVDVRLLDHLVVGDVNAVSFAERGWL